MADEPAAPLPSLILDHLGDAVITTDPDFRVTTWNRAAREIYGYELAEARGLPTMALLKTTFDLEDEEQRARARQSAIAALLRDGVWRGEVIQSRKDGRKLHVHSEVRILLGPDGTRIGAVAVNRDVTPQREAQDALARMEAHLTELQRAEALGKLAGSVAHDFNNLLAIIQGHADLALLAVPARHPARRSLDEIIAGVDRGSMLSRQLLSFGRRDTLDVTTFDLVDAVTSVNAVLRCLIGTANRLELRMPDRAWVRGSRAEAEQVLINLCANAREALVRPGTVTIAIEQRDDGVVELSVTDTGVGMSPEVAARAFEPFFTTRPPGRGSGLGLAVVARVVHRFGGSVSIDSTEGVGTRVALLLCAGAEGERALPVAAAVSGRLRVLVAEDQELVREVLAGLLRSLGHEVIAAADGQAALVLAGSTSFDLLLTDVSMPRLTGPALAQALRAQRPSLPVIYLSGFPVADTKPWPVGVWRQKPITRSALARALAEALAQSTV
jgi:two-component system cell cycle sensor histidine kinase/response regulator CckA